MKPPDESDDGAAISPEAFYAWLRRGLPGDLDTLRAEPAEALRRALVAAVESNIITAQPRDHEGPLRFRDLATLDPDDWRRALQSAGTAIPESTSLSVCARTLAMKSAGAYPDHAVRHGVTRWARELTSERIGWLAAVLEQNPDVKFLDLDYSPDSAALSAVDFGTLPDAARKCVLADLEAQQRIYRATGNVIPALEIMRASRM